MFRLGSAQAVAGKGALDPNAIARKLSSGSWAPGRGVDRADTGGDNSMSVTVSVT